MKKIVILVILCMIPLLNISAQRHHHAEKGHWTATYYGNHYKGKRKTANGDTFNMHAMTCAAPKKFKFGTKLRITNIKNNKSVVVKVTDRGAFGSHTIDLTYGAFGKIARHRDGRIKVKVEVVKY